MTDERQRPTSTSNGHHFEDYCRDMGPGWHERFDWHAEKARESDSEAGAVPRGDPYALGLREMAQPRDRGPNRVSVNGRHGAVDPVHVRRVAAMNIERVLFFVTCFLVVSSISAVTTYKALVAARDRAEVTFRSTIDP